MLPVKKWPRMRVRAAAIEVPWAPCAVPGDWVLIFFAAVFCFCLSATSNELLVASAERDGGRVVACRYFTGTRVVERQHAATLSVAAGKAGRRACPLVRAGR